jgi:hypothetical protein
MGAGKSTLADLICGEFNSFADCSVAKVCSFADKLKQVAKDLYNMEGKDRKLLQTLGDKMRQVTDDFGTVRSDVWVDYLLRTIGADKYNSVFVIDDLRYHNEFAILKRRGFFLIRIETDEELRLERLNMDREAFDEASSHLSEIDLDGESDWNLRFVNNNSMYGMKTYAEEVFKETLDKTPTRI